MDAISCLAPPAALLSTAAFTDAAIARALHFSMSDSSAAASSSAPSPLLADFASGTGGVGFASAPPMITCASKRAPTTYISTNPANFRHMVQQITGVQADGILPTTFDASALLAGAFGNPLLPAVASDDAALHHHHQQQPQPQPCFPTLDSWSVMYENSELL